MRTSYVLFCDYLRGEGAAPLHDFVAAMVSGKALDEITKSVERMLAIGSTSGWDLLAGAMMGMLLIADSTRT